MPSFYALLDNATPFDPQRTFVTSWLIPPLALAILRLLFSLYAFTVTFTQWGILGARGDASVIGPEFSYFTNLTWWGISFYTLVAGVHTLFYALKGSSPLTSLPRPLQALHSFFYTTIITLPFLVTIVYWAVLYDGPWFTHAYNAWSNVGSHLLPTGLQTFSNTQPTDLPPRPQLARRPRRTPPPHHQFPALAPPPRPHPPPRALPQPRLPHSRHSGFLHVQLSGP